MKRAGLRFTILIALLFAFTLGATAQSNPNLETGLKPNGSYEGGNIDSISLTTGNLTLHIPLFSYPQRGSLPGDIHLSYNNKNWYVFQWCQNAICHDEWRWNPRTLYGVFTNMDGGAGVSYVPFGGAYLFTAYTSDGSSHQLAPDNAGGLRSIDGTGIWYAGGNGLNGLATTVRTRDGSQPLKVDPNGNLATASNPNQNYPSATILNDTLNRYLPGTGNSTADYSGCIPPAAPAQINSAAISTLPGTNRQIKYCSATYTFTTNFQQFDAVAGVPIAEGTETTSFPVSVVLYNGTSWSTSPAWGFNYQDSYGDLTKITLPTGGTISYGWGTTTLCTVSEPLTQVSRTVSTRTVDAQDGTGPKTWAYGRNCARFAEGGLGAANLRSSDTKYPHDLMTALHRRYDEQ